MRVNPRTLLGAATVLSAAVVPPPYGYVSAGLAAVSAAVSRYRWIWLLTWLSSIAAAVYPFIDKALLSLVAW